MANEIEAALNTYDDSGNIKARGFETQNELLLFLNDNRLSGVIKEKDVLWKGNVRSIMGLNEIYEFYRIVIGSLKDTLIKNYHLQKKHERDPVPEGYTTPDPYVETFYNLYYYLDNPKWLAVWKDV
jgi:hypothetical protein